MGERKYPIKASSNGDASLRVAYQHSYSGPLPDPESLAKYNAIIPNGAERIMKMAELEQQNRHETERTILKADIKSAKRGQLLGFILVVVLVAAGIVAILSNAIVVGSVIFGTTILGIASVFVQYSKNAKNK